MSVGTDTTTARGSHRRYRTIADGLDGAIRAGVLPRGTLIYEGPIAELFGTSRTPVRRALEHLHGEGVISRHGGRGYVVGPDADVDVTRRVLTPAMVGIRHGARPPAFRGSAERLADDLELALSEAFVFGGFRVHEQAAAEHYGVSRTVVRELLTRMQARRLVRKTRSSHWVTGPLTSEGIARFYDIRARLEPLALRQAAPNVGPSLLERVAGRAARAASAPHDVSLARHVELEADLHERLLGECRNEILIDMIGQCHPPLAVNRLFVDRIGPRASWATFEEHQKVISALARGAVRSACEALEAHITCAARRTKERLKTLSVLPRPDMPPFLQSWDEGKGGAGREGPAREDRD